MDKMNVTPGFYWARFSPDHKWELVEVTNAEHFPVFVMGWDETYEIDTYSDYVKCRLITPDGEEYKARTFSRRDTEQ